jgi:lambda family phage tail tape measure protein
MADVVGRGVIEVSADASKLKAGIDDAKRSIKSFGKDVSGSVGTASARASNSIDRYVRSLQTQAATTGKSARETELYKLALRGASEAQLGAANNALRMSEAYEKGVVMGQRLKAGLIAIAAAATAAGVAMVASGIETLDKLDDLSEKTGVTVEKLSALRFAGETTGTSFEALSGGLNKLSKTMAEAAGGNKEAIATFATLGVEVKNADGTLRAADAVLADVATRFAGYEDGAAKAALAQRVFGKSGADMIPLLNQGAAGLERARIEAEKLGAVFDGNIARAAADFNDNLAKIKLASEGAAISISGPLIQSLARLSQEFIEAKKNGGLFEAGLASYKKGVAEFWSGDMFGGSKGKGKTTKEIQDAVNALGGPSAGGGRGFFNPKVAAPVVQDPEKKAGGGGRGGGGVDTAAQEAKARLAFDLDEIRKSQEALSNTIANGEKVMEARRSASLISESDYYAQKRAFIQQNDQVQQAAAEKEIARLQAEKLAGKDKIDNDRKIADAQSKLSKLRENAATNLEVLAIKEKDSLDSIQRAYDDAAAAARGYLEVVQRAADAEIAGIGRGEKARGRQAQLSGIEEKFEAQRQALQRDNRNGKFAGRPEDYQRELALLNDSQAKEIAIYQAKYAKLDEMQADWANGAMEALQNYSDEAQNTAQMMQDAFTNAFNSAEDALVGFVKTGKIDIESLVDSIIADFARIAIKQGITGPLANALMGAIGSGGGSSSGAGSSDLIGSLVAGLAGGGRAIGGPVHAGGLYKVNEKGPGEVFEAGGSQWLMAANDGQIKAAANGGGGVTVHNTFVLDQPASRETQQQVARRAGQSIDAAVRRNG